MGKTILVVDDDNSILRVIRKTLEMEGYYIDTASTGRQAMDKLRERHYDLALVDVWLPDMKGTQLLADAKKELATTVKIIITGYPSPESEAKAREGEADSYIIKPIRMDELISVVNFFTDKNKNPYVSSTS